MPNAVCDIPIECKGDTADVLIYQQIGNSFFEEGLTAKAFAENLKALGKGIKTINVRINSPGGSVFDGTAIYNTLRNHGAKVVTHNEGAALSIASLIFMAGDERRMAKNGYLMIHDPSGVARGTAEDMRKMADMLDKVKETTATTYADRTGKEKADVAEMMTKETWLTAKEAKELGFVDTVTDEVTAVAAFDPQMFANVPAELVTSLSPKEPAMSSPNPQPEFKAATVQEIKNACPGCDDSFVVKQMEKGATVIQAVSDWLKESTDRTAAMKAENTMLKSEIESLKAELANEKGRKNDPPAGPVAGVDPLPVGGPPAAPSANAREEFDSLVQEKVSAGVPKARAISQVVKEQPALHKALLAEANKR